MRPVKQWVPNGKRYCIGPLFKSLIRMRIAGDELFIDTEGAHCPPFVMVAIQPDLCDVFKLVIVSDLIRRQVIMVINDRQILRVFVV